MKLKKHGWIVLAAIFIIIIIGALLPSKGTVEIMDNEDPVVEAEPKFYLTLPADTLRFEDHTIASGESFGALLGKRGISTAHLSDCRGCRACVQCSENSCRGYPEVRHGR